MLSVVVEPVVVSDFGVARWLMCGGKFKSEEQGEAERNSELRVSPAPVPRHTAVVAAIGEDEEEREDERGGGARASSPSLSLHGEGLKVHTSRGIIARRTLCRDLNLIRARLYSYSNSYVLLMTTAKKITML